jgi:hypothetical protein
MMKLRLSAICVLLVVKLFSISQKAQAQFLVDMIDTSVSEEKGLWAIYRKADHLQISGYFQPQYQVSQSKGIESYSGGDFAENSNNRFMMRRARIRFDYAHFNEEGDPSAQVVFQFDGTERGVVIRDFWGRVYENRFRLFSFTTGMFARPFGYEINLSSGDREAPERGRMSQILMRTERDLGIMGTFEPRRGKSTLRLLKVDFGIFNGQGLTATEEFDSYKDFIGRIYLKPYPINKTVSLSLGASFFEGGIVQSSRYMYRFSDAGGVKNFVADSALTNIGRKAPRRYRGFDGQVRIKHAWGRTELRAEYWWGVQTGYESASNTPSTPLNKPFYVRKFDGAFLHLLQNIVNDKNQIILKYDFYDPNRQVGGGDIGRPGLAFSKGDIRFNTFGFGYLHHFNTHLKFVGWYDIVRNENTQMEEYTGDIKDNVLTLRLQYRF